MLDADPTVVWLVAQPCVLAFKGQVGGTRHVPDLLSVDDRGRVTLWDVRPDKRADARFWRTADMTRRACEDVGWAYEVFQGEPVAQRLNRLWLSGFRREQPWHSAMTWRILDALTASRDDVCLSDLLELDPGTGELTSTVWHLLWSQRIVCDLAEPLAGSTIVTLTDRAFTA